MLSLLGLLFAADSWEPVCVKSNDSTVWFVLTSPTPAVIPDFDCKGLFFGDILCTTSVGFGRVDPKNIDERGYPNWELRYLPYGDKQTILAFLAQPATGVVYRLPRIEASTPAAIPTPPDPEELLRLHLRERAAASNATAGVTVHIWTCPNYKLEAPEDVMTPLGMKAQMHRARPPLVEPQ